LLLLPSQPLIAVLSILHHESLLLVMEKLSAETRENFSKWISTEYNNEVLFDLIASDLLGIFPNKRLFLESKHEIYKFIIESLPIDVQNLYNKKFQRKIVDEDIQPRKDKKNLLSRLYRLFLKLSNKLYGSDLTSFVVPNDTIDDGVVSRPSSPRQLSSEDDEESVKPSVNTSIEINTDDEDEDVVVSAPPEMKTSIEINTDDEKTLKGECILCCSTLDDETIKPFACSNCKLEVCINCFMVTIELNTRKLMFVQIVVAKKYFCVKILQKS
jgi:hypothetical protein